MEYRKAMLKNGGTLFHNIIFYTQSVKTKYNEYREIHKK